MKITEQLQKLGFSQNKAKTYLACLELGSAPASTIAQKAGLERTTTYKLLEELASEELIDEDVATKVKTYVARSPKELLQHLQEKQKTADSLIPILLEQVHKATRPPRIRFYSGLRGVKQVFEDALTVEKKVVYTFSPIQSILDHFGPTYARHYLAQRKKFGITRQALRQLSDKKGIPGTWDLFASDERTAREVRFLPKGIAFQSLIQIYDEKISFISFSEHYYAFIIENKELTDFMKQIFQLLWIGSKFTLQEKTSKSDSQD
ncbi:MAG: helix-turn-helix domain-containing protein [Smithella sp.]|jgi:sugar-specific transcriptional regulator TrmB